MKAVKIMHAFGMQRILLIFDEGIRLRDLFNKLQINMNSEIALFPLTSHWDIVHKVYDICLSINHVKIKIDLLDSAVLINNEVDRMRREVVKWSSNLGNCKLRNKSLKEWFLTPRKDVSQWWFSLLSEKNTLKTDVFFRIAQVNAIKKIMEEGDYDLGFISVSDKRFLKSIQGVAKKVQIETMLVATARPTPIKERLNYFFCRLGLIGELLLAFHTLVIFYWHGIQARRCIGNVKHRMPDVNSLLFVSYFPAIEKEAASRGTFRNKYALALQDKFSEWAIKVVWLLMYVPVDGHSFQDAATMAKNFARNGEKLFMFNEFMSLKILFQCLAFWLRQICISVFLYGTVKKTYLNEEPVRDECEPLLKALWHKSFCGSVGIQGILFFLVYKKIFRTIPNISDCLYYCEMHAWEKGLNAAKKIEKPTVRTIGFVHTSIPRNYFHYFYDHSEIKQTGHSTDMPLPNVIACNGHLVSSLLRESGCSNLVVVEAVRHLDISPLITQELEVKKGEPVLLIAGSIDHNETKTLVSLVHSAFPNAAEIDIWFKAHPSIPFEAIFEELGIDPCQRGYKMRGGSIQNSLADAWAVVVTSSTVAIEALAYGCRVLAPIVPDIMFMNPLAGFDDYYLSISTPEQLREQIKLLNIPQNEKERDRNRKFLRQYWCIDPNLPKWRDLLFKNNCA